MNSVENCQLKNIQECLSSAKIISEDKTLTEIIFHLSKERAEIPTRPFIDSPADRSIDRFVDPPIDFSNYKIGSFSLNNSKEADGVNCLDKALDALITKQILTHRQSDLLLVNSIVTNSRSPQWRLKSLDKTYPFPDPSLIEEGMNRLLQFIKEVEFEFNEKNKVKEFVYKVAFIQGLLSLHPFEDGNHRTSRLLLDYWLWELGLPTTHLNYASDFIIANSTKHLVFSLEEAIQKIIYTISYNFSNPVLV